MNKITEKTNPRIKEKYYHILHESGLNIYVIPKDMSTFYAVFGTKYGSIDSRFRFCDEDSYCEVPMGIAHFLEHKMFENENGSDVFSQFAQTGANANAYTSFDKTAYLFSCTERFFESLEILLSFVTSPYFTEKSVQKEQGIIAEEIKMYEDMPSSVLFYNLLGAMYRSHPIKINIAGTVESISEITPAVLYRCHSTFYNPQNMTLCLCGRVDPEEVLKVVNKVIRSSPARPFERSYPDESPRVTEKSVSTTAPVSMPMFMLGMKDVSISPDPLVRQRKGICVDLILDMLFGKTSEFYEELYREGLVRRPLHADYEHNRNFSFATVSAETKDPAELERRIKNVIELARCGKFFTEEDFLRAKRALFSDAITAFDSTEEISNSFLDFIFDDFDMLDYTDTIASVSFAELKAVIEEQMFSPEAMSVSVITPETRS